MSTFHDINCAAVYIYCQQYKCRHSDRSLDLIESLWIIFLSMVDWRAGFVDLGDRCVAVRCKKQRRSSFSTG